MTQFPSCPLDHSDLKLDDKWNILKIKLCFGFKEVEALFAHKGSAWNGVNAAHLAFLWDAF